MHLRIPQVFEQTLLHPSWLVDLEENEMLSSRRYLILKFHKHVDKCSKDEKKGDIYSIR
jgi:hypothetical protein